MGVDIGTYRQRIGGFMMPDKMRYTLNGIVASWNTAIGGFRLCLALSLLLVCFGDVETNPGPRSWRNKKSRPSTRRRNRSSAEEARGKVSEEYVFFDKTIIS